MRTNWTIEELEDIIYRDDYPHFKRLLLQEYAGPGKPRRIVFFNHDAEQRGSLFAFCDDTPENRGAIVQDMKEWIEKHSSYEFSESDLAELIEVAISNIGSRIKHYV